MEPMIFGSQIEREVRDAGYHDYKLGSIAAELANPDAVTILDPDHVKVENASITAAILMHMNRDKSTEVSTLLFGRFTNDTARAMYRAAEAWTETLSARVQSGKNLNRIKRALSDKIATLHDTDFIYKSNNGLLGGLVYVDQTGGGEGSRVDFISSDLLAVHKETAENEAIIFTNNLTSRLRPNMRIPTAADQAAYQLCRGASRATSRHDSPIIVPRRLSATM